MPIYEFICQGLDCANGNEQVIARLCSFNEKSDQKCEACFRPLVSIMSAPPGYVWDGLSNKVNHNKK